MFLVDDGLIVKQINDVFGFVYFRWSMMYFRNNSSNYLSFTELDDDSPANVYLFIEFIRNTIGE